MPPKRPTSRRMTLGGVPSNVVPPSERKNINANVASAKKAKRPNPPNGRRSMIPRVGSGRENTMTIHPPTVPPSPSVSVMSSSAASRSRRQSMSAAPNPPAPLPPTTKQDPRPLSDKAFQEKSIRKILDYLRKSSYPYQISSQALQRLSGADFVRVMTFMLKQFDPLFHCQKTGPIKFEDEVVLFYKFLGYPFTLSKTSIVTAGSPHAWPGLVGALVWLVEHYECMAQQPRIDYLRSPPTPTSVEEIGDNSERAFMQFILESYQAYMTDDEEKKKEAELALLQRFDIDDEIIRQDWDRKQDLNASIVENIQHLKQEKLQFECLVQKRDAYLVDLEQYQDLIRRMEEHKEKLEKKVDDRSQELGDAKDKLQKTFAEIEECKAKVRSQSMTVQEERKLQSESKGLSEAIDRVEKQKALIATEITKEENERAEIQKQLEVCLENFRAKLTELEDKLPENMRAAAKKVSEWKKLTVQDLRNDKSLMQEIKLVYVRGRAALEKHLEGLKDWHKDVLDQLQQSEQKLQETIAKRKYFEEKTAKLQSVLESQAATHQAKLAVREKEIAAMENKIAALEDPVVLEEQIAASERQCRQLEAMRIKHEQDNVERKRHVEQKICEAVDQIVEHEKFYEERVKEVDDYLQMKLSSAGAIQIPTNVKLDDESSDEKKK